MAESVSLDGLEFEISAVTSDAIKNLDSLSQSLKALKSAVDTNIGGAVAKFQDLNKAISAVSENNPIHKLAESLEKISGISKLSNIKVPELKVSDNFSENIMKISGAIESFSTDKISAFSGLNDVAQNLNNLNQAISSFGSDALEEKAKKIQNVLNTEVGTEFLNRYSQLEVITEYFPTVSLAAVANALDQIRTGYTLTLPESFIDNFRLLADTADRVTDNAVAKISGMAFSLKSWHEVKDVKFPSGFNTALSNFNIAISKTDEKKLPVLTAIGQAMKGFSGLGDIKISSSFANQIAKISDALKKLKNSDVNKLKKLADAIKTLDGVGNKSIKLKINTSDTDKAKKSTLSLASVMSKAFFTPLKYARKLSVAIGKSILSPIQKVASRLKTVIAGFGKIIKLRAFRFIITSITSGIKEGTDNLYQFSKGINGEFAKSMDTLATSMLYFKNSVGAAIAPVINQLAPAVDLLVDKIVDGTNKINQFLAQMTGASYWTKAVEYPKEYAEAVDDAKKSVQDFTMGFDELNIISDNSSNKASSELDYSKMFEIVDLQKNPWTEQLKNAIESGDWYGAGNLLGEKFNSIFANIDYEGAGRVLGTKINNAISLAKGFLDIADFETVGTGIASFLNAGFEQINFYNLGSVLAGKWNVIIDTVHGFVTEFKFAEFGKDLSDAVNGWFDTIDLNKAAQSIQIGLEGILDTAYTFLTNVDFRGIGEKIGDALNQFDIPTILGKFAQTASAFAIGVFDTLSGFLQKVDWQKLGTDIFNSVGEIIKNIDWAGVTSSFAEFLGSAIGAVGGLLWGIIKPLIDASWNLGEKFYDKFTEDGKFSWKGFLNGIKDALVGVGTWIKTNILDPFMNGFKKAFGIASPSKVMKEQGDFIISGLKNGITNAWSNLKSWVKEHIFDPFINGFKKLFGINSPSSVMAEQGTFIIAGLKNGITNAWNRLKEWTKEHIFDPFVNNVKKLFGINSAPSTEMETHGKSISEGLKKGITSAWDVGHFVGASVVNPFLTTFKNLFGIHSPSTVMEEQGGFLAEGLKNGISDKWHNVTDLLSEKTDSIKSSVSSAFGNIKDTTSEIFNGFGDGIKGGLNSAIGYIESFINSAIHAFNDFGGRLGSFSFDAPDWVQETFGIGGWSIGFPYLEDVHLPRFDKGGFPNSGDLFFANENGRPEFVGSMGGRTAVANNDQIVEGIYEAVYSAMMAVMSNQGNDGNTEINLYLDSKQIAAEIEKRKLSRGRTIFTGGVANEF